MFQYNFSQRIKLFSMPLNAGVERQNMSISIREAKHISLLLHTLLCKSLFKTVLTVEI